jgi:hypothetical protein
MITTPEPFYFLEESRTGFFPPNTFGENGSEKPASSVK